MHFIPFMHNIFKLVVFMKMKIHHYIEMYPHSNIFIIPLYLNVDTSKAGTINRIID